MALTQVTGPYPIFTDLDGSPLDDGYLYIGAANQDPETNPIQVFWDSALTIPATQPIRTNNGYAWRSGTPGLLYTAGEFSITIRNKRNEFVLYSPLGYGFDPKAVSAAIVKNDFIGNGIQTNFTLSSAPSTILATNIFINGVYQEKDSYNLIGNVIIFTVAPPLGSSIEIMTNETGVINGGNANDITYTLTEPGAVLQSVQSKLEQYVSVKDFGALGDGVADDTAAIQAAIDTQKAVYFPEGEYLISATLSVTYQGAKLFGSGITGTKSTLKRDGDVNFGPLINVAVGAEGFILTDLKIREQDATYTNTSPLVTIRSNDFTVQRCWFWYGYRQLNLTQGASNATIIGNTFETARKQAIYTYSSGLLKIIGNSFWKCTADYSNPADRSQVIGLFKDPAYSFGTWDVNIVGNYFYEAVFGNFIEMDGAEGIQITGNFFTIPSQVDSGQRDDINISNSTLISITGNTSNAVLNSYIAGQRGARYCINLVTGNSDISIVGNTLLQGVAGTINDPSNIAVVMGNSCTQAVPDVSREGIQLPNATKGNNVLSWYEQAPWTPYLDFGGAHVGQTYSLQAGTFTRVGRVITLSGSIALSNIGSSTGVATISGLPYASNATPTAYIIFTDGGISLTGQLGLFNGGNNSAFSLQDCNGGTVTALTNADFTTPTIRFCIQYESV